VAGCVEDLIDLSLLVIIVDCLVHYSIVCWCVLMPIDVVLERVAQVLFARTCVCSLFACRWARTNVFECVRSFIA
jgi:hypothetical protein